MVIKMQQKKYYSARRLCANLTNEAEQILLKLNTYIKFISSCRPSRQNKS